MRSSKPIEVHIESLSHDGRGIVSINDKVTFVHNALPTEDARIVIKRKHRRYDEAEAIEILHPAADRVTPACPHANICGGCSLQHLSPVAQLAFHEQSVKDLLMRTGRLAPAQWLPPITSPDTGYRRKARLGVRYVRKKEKLLVGFREKQSNYLADIHTCAVLDPRVGLKLPGIANLIRGMQNFDAIPQIEMAIGDDTVALVFRHLQPLSENDIDLLVKFGKLHEIDLYLQPGSPDTIHKIHPQDGQSWLTYSILKHNVVIRFHPTDFTQVNHYANQAMIDLALTLLNPKPTDRVLDLFCGLGNFSLPIARHAGFVIGVEGSLDMVKRARENALLNQLHSKTAFFMENLIEPDPNVAWMQETYDSVLLDPPRTGAREILPFIRQMDIDRIVYISCHPATLARDAAILVNEYGYELQSAGIINMFPHTGHIETIALFEKSSRKRSHGHHRQTKVPSSA